MSKELIERLRLMLADSIGNDAADALESLEAAYASAVEAGKALAKQALKAEQERDALAISIREAAVKAGICRNDAPPTGPILIMLCGNMADSIVSLAAELKALREQKPVALVETAGEQGGCIGWFNNGEQKVGASLYAHPVPTRELTGAVDALAQHIRQIDGNHSMGAGALAEGIAEWADRYLKGEGE